MYNNHSNLNISFSLTFCELTMLCYAKSLQSCPTLCEPMDGSPPGSPVPGILQARVLEWGAIAFSGELTGHDQMVLKWCFLGSFPQTHLG